ncbi:MAG TPA: SGNH/GDSL hydrolase family protein, partial [Polyangiaceae bacterium]
PASASPPPPASALPPASASARSPQHYLVAAIGDSLSDPRSHGGGYLEYLKTRCPSIEIDNFAKGGAMVNQMRRSFEQQVATSSRRYTHLVIFGGVNDLYSDLTALRTPAKIEADLGSMYAWGKAHQVTVVALTVAPWGGFERYFNASRAEATRTLNAWIREQPRAGHADHVVDAYALLSCGDPERLCDRLRKPFKDGIHFGPEGQALLGQALFKQAFSECE